MNTKKAVREDLQVIPWFQELNPVHFEKLVETAHVVESERDEILFSEGDPEDYLYILLTGRVTLEIHSPIRGRLRVFTAEPLDVIGWSSVTPVVRQRTASARCILPSRLVALDAKKLYEACEADVHLGYIVMRRMANVVAGRLTTTRLQLLDLFYQPEEPSTGD